MCRYADELIISISAFCFYIRVLNLVMTEYQNLPENYPLFIEYYKRFLPFSVLIFLCIVTYTCYTSGIRDAIAQLVIFIVVFAVSSMMGRKRQKQVFYSYKLIIDDEILIRKQSNLPDIIIPLNEITRIDEMNRGDISSAWPAKR